MERIFIFSLIFTITKGFMFDQLSDKLRCQGISMMCPPMCLVHDSSGCSTCDCSNIDPSHPKLPGSGNTGGNNVDPSNPLSGHNNFPGSAGCYDWTKCACVPTVNAASGCLECPCGQAPVTNTFPTTKPTQPSTKPIEIQSPGNQPSTHTFSHAAAVTRPFSHTSVLPPDVTSSSTSKPATSTTSTVTKTSAVMTSAKVTSPEIDTNLPSIATIPSMNTVTTMLTTSTLAPFVCPGVFSCSLDCYAGFAMDNSGCPLCQCAPIPTDLP